jgi:IS66 Orf2 like protein
MLTKFRNRRGDRIKILAWDQGGFWVLYKRLERGTFAWPADDHDPRVEMPSTDLLLLLSGVDLAHTRRRRATRQRAGAAYRTDRDGFGGNPSPRPSATTTDGTAVAAGSFAAFLTTSQGANDRRRL